MVKRFVLRVINYILHKLFDMEATSHDAVGAIEAANYVVSFLQLELFESEKKNFYYEDLLKEGGFEVIRCHECQFVKDNMCINPDSKRNGTKVVEQFPFSKELKIKYSAPGCKEMMEVLNSTFNKDDEDESPKVTH